jgi:hypothetical protein
MVLVLKITIVIHRFVNAGVAVCAVASGHGWRAKQEWGDICKRVAVIVVVP